MSVAQFMLPQIYVYSIRFGRTLNGGMRIQQTIVCSYEVGKHVLLRLTQLDLMFLNKYLWVLKL